MSYRGSLSVTSHQNEGYLFILPYIIFIIIFFLFPTIGNIVLSFTDYNLREVNFVGLRNYRLLMSDPVFRQSVWNTVVYTIFTVPVSMACGLSLALMVNRRIPGLSFYRTLIFMPHIMSMVVVSMMWLWLYEFPFGVINNVLAAFGGRRQPWLFDPATALGSIIALSVWKSLGYNTIILLAGIHNIPKYLYEAAIIDGARAHQRLFYITIPMLRPITFFLVIIGLVNSFQVFEQVNVLTAGGPMNKTTTVTHQIYSRGIQQVRMGYASAIAVLLLLALVLTLWANFRYGKEGHDVDA
jgi:ABC-type sugar transport system permease subunit